MIEALPRGDRRQNAITMSLIPTWTSPAIAALLVAPATSQQDGAAAEPIALTVEYVGSPDTDRGRAFTALLREHFAEVQATEAGAIHSPAAAADAFDDADVVVIDANLVGRLPDGYPKPLVVISGAGVHTAESIGAKLDWL